MSLRKSSNAVPSKSTDSEHAGRSKPQTQAGEKESSPTWQMLATRPGGVQAKLTVSQPNDPFEQEADRVADRVMRMEAPGVIVQRKCAGCEEEEQLQRKETSSEAAEAAPSMVHDSGAPLDSTTRTYMEQCFGHDFDKVRVHTGGQADAAARQINSLAFTLGKDVVFREGQYAPHSNSGRRLLAHELTHVVQQSSDSATPAVQRQDAPAPTPASMPLRVDPKKLEPVTTTGVAAATTTLIFDTRGEIIAIVNQGTQLKVTAKPKDEDLEVIKKGEFWTQPGATRPELFYEVEYFGRMRGGAIDEPIKGYVLTNWITIGGQPAGPSAAVTKNDWMSVIPEHGKTGDAGAISTSAKDIQEERQHIESRPFSFVAKEGETKPREGLMSKADDRTKAYRTWLDAPDTRPSLAKDTKDIRWLAFKKVFDAEGDPSAIMTYDKTNITWGVGFSGAGNPGVGLTEQMMARLFNQSAESRDAFWRAGITVVGTEMVAVKIINAEAGKAEKLRGTKAENFVREQKQLLSLMTNVTIGLHQRDQKDPDEFVRQDNLDAQFETFLHNTLRGSEGIIDGMTPYAAAVAAHSVHTGQHSWGQYKGVTDISGVEAAIKARITYMENDKKSKGKDSKFGFIIPLAQIKANIKK